MTPAEQKEIDFGNRMLAQAGLPPLTSEQETRFLANRREREYPPSLPQYLIIGAALGYTLGRITL